MEESFNKKIDEIINSTDGMRQAEPRPFLFARIEARMQSEKNVWSRMSSFVARPIVALACICLVILLNAAVIWFSDTSGSGNPQQSSELATADEYNQVNYTLYEFENAKP